MADKKRYVKTSIRFWGNTDRIAELFSELTRGSWPQKINYDPSKNPQLEGEADVRLDTDPDEFCSEIKKRCPFVNFELHDYPVTLDKEDYLIMIHPEFGENTHIQPDYDD